MDARTACGKGPAERVSDLKSFRSVATHRKGIGIWLKSSFASL